MEQKVCAYCKKPIEPQDNLMPTWVPVCSSEKCQHAYYADRKQVFSMLAGIGGRTLV